MEINRRIKLKNIQFNTTDPDAITTQYNNNVIAAEVVLPHLNITISHFFTRIYKKICYNHHYNYTYNIIDLNALSS